MVSSSECSPRIEARSCKHLQIVQCLCTCHSTMPQRHFWTPSWRPCSNIPHGNCGLLSCTMLEILFHFQMSAAHLKCETCKLCWFIKSIGETNVICKIHPADTTGWICIWDTDRCVVRSIDFYFTMSHYRLKPIVTLCHVTHNIMRPESFRRCQDWITDSHGPYVSMHVRHKRQ